MTTDLHGNQITEGDRVRVWLDGNAFTARIGTIWRGKGRAQGTDLLGLVRDDGVTKVRDSNAVELLP